LNFGKKKGEGEKVRDVGFPKGNSIERTFALVLFAQLERK